LSKPSNLRKLLESREVPIIAAEVSELKLKEDFYSVVPKITNMVMWKKDHFVDLLCS